ncbi:hypothetical protein ACKWTF_016120 [Chironomus riparius]
MMKDSWLGILILVVACCEYADLQDTPISFPICSKRDPDIGKCITSAINKLRKNLATGKLSPDITIPPVDPYGPVDFDIDQKLFKIRIHDLYFYGGTNYIIKNFRAYFDGNRLRFMPQVEYDRFDIKSKYSIEGILPKPMTGDFSFSVLDAKFHGNGSVLLYKKDGVEYFEIEDAKLSVDRLKLGNIKLTLPNGMNMKVGPIVSSILNVNDGILFRMLLKASKGKIDEAHANFKNSFIKDLPVSYIFSD